MTEHPNPTPFVTWSGTDIQTDDDKAVAEIEEFYETNYLAAVTARYPSVVDVARYELLATDRHGGFGAKLLTGLTWGGEPELDENDLQHGSPQLHDAPATWEEGTSTSWSLLYRYLAETGPASVPPYAIYLVGVNPPAGISDEDRAAFIEFYTSVHVPEVAKRRHCTRSTLYELDRELLHPNEGAPQFLGAYEVADAAAVVTRHVGFGYSRGPSVWEKHKTPWRLWYRNVAG
jgi:hypothetical protein